MSGWAAKQKKKAAFAEQRMLDDGPGERAVNDAKDSAMGKGEESLFGKKLSKEDAKKEKEAKKAEAKAKRDAKKAEKAAAKGATRRDINVRDVAISFHGANLIENTDFSLNYGNRYGFIGPNGSGKSTIMKAIAAVPAHPESIDLYFLAEVPATDTPALQAVFEVDDERKQLEAEAERVNDAIGACDDEDEQTAQRRLNGLYASASSAATAEVRASTILHGLGFTPKMQTMATKEFSGGWRMRYVAERKVRDDEQQRKYDAEQRDIAEIKDFIARFGHGTVKMVRQAQSREKLLAKKLEEGLTAKPSRDAEWDFSFPDPGELPTPVLMIQDVSFAYPGCEPSTTTSTSASTSSRIARRAQRRGQDDLR
ncbi:ATPase [Aureococcus anophagefferens]|nr:ATPase [Aureococcus anophagefferens]